MGGSEWVNDLAHDLRFALRQLRRSPAFTLVAVLTLALGIGANSAVFSVVNGVLLRPLSYPESHELVRVWTRFLPESGFEFPAFSLSPWEAIQYRDDATALRSLGYYREGAVTLTGEEPQRVVAVFGDHRLMPTLGVPPLLGRWLDPAEDLPGGPSAAVLGYDLWRARFGGDPSIVGRTILVDGLSTEVVGVMPEHFAFPDRSVQLYAALHTDEENPGGRSSHEVMAVGRLAEGVSPAQASAELESLNVGWREAYGHPQPGHFLYLADLRTDLVADVDQVLWVLMASVTLVLLIASANVANLLLARGEGRLKEVSLKIALGAGRTRIVRQLLTESVVLASVGATLGLALAFGGLEAVRYVNADALPRMESVTIDGTVLAFTILVTLGSAFLFGLVPALQTGGRATARGLASDTRATPSQARRRLRRALVTTEVALSVVIVVSAGLVGRSFVRLLTMDPGLNAEGRLTFGLSLPESDYPSAADVEVFLGDLLDRLRAVPGVTSVSFSSHLPFAGGFHLPSFDIEGRVGPAAGERDTSAKTARVTPGYVETMGIDLVSGRSFDSGDRAESEPVALVNEEAARAYWPDEDPVGRRLRIRTRSGAEWARIVGVVENTRVEGLDVPFSPQLYLVQSQSYRTMFRVTNTGSVILRTSLAPLSVVPAARATLAGLDPDLPMTDIRSMEDLVSTSVAQPRLASGLLGTFALVAFLLATVGVYGIVSYSVARRTREIGIRLALGADKGRVLGLMLREGTTPAIVGVALGVAGGLAATSLLKGMLFQVSPTDPLTFLTLPLLLMVVAGVASWIPARHATRVAPVEALRQE